MIKRKLENILKKNILVSLPGNFDIKDGYILTLPIVDIVGGFCFENSSSPDGLYIWWFIQPLYIPDDILHLTFGNRIKTNKGSDLWDFSTKEIENSTKDLLPKLELSKKLVDDLEFPLNFYNHNLTRKETNIRIYEATTYTACWLGLLNMYDEIENCLAFIKRNLDISIPWINELSDNLNLIKMQGNQEDILKVLKQWKEGTLVKLKLKT